MNNVKIFAAFAVFVVFNTVANAADFVAKATMTWSSDGTSTAKTFAVEGTFTKAVAEYDYSAEFEFVLMADGDSELRSFSFGVAATPVQRYRCDGIPWYGETPPRTFADDDFPIVPRTFADDDLPPAPRTFAYDEPRTFAETSPSDLAREAVYGTVAGAADALLGSVIQEPRTFATPSDESMSVPRTFTEQALAASRDAVRKSITPSIKPLYRSYGPAPTSILVNGAGSATRY